jgi:uncharacterized RDD family membrane protein YckC
VEASAAQKRPVTKTCSQCGAILDSSVRACSFCDSPFISDSAQLDVTLARERAREAVLRGEVAQRVAAYRARRRKSAGADSQAKLPFEAAAAAKPSGSVAVAEDSASNTFSFTIAIGRTSNAREDSSRMVIDLSEPEQSAQANPRIGYRNPEPGLYPAASIEDRRIAGLADAACVLFAYGAFLALFGSLGGQFTVSKLSAAVCTATLAIVYIQYFALFTIFGGTTPGMMLRGLHVVSVDGEPPTPRQMLLRAAGYLFSAGTFFLGFLWAMWDEDSLTWHDRLSRTYLAEAQNYAEMEPSSAAHGR